MKTLTKTKTRAEAKSQVGLDSVSKGSIAAMGGVSALIGLWAVACFVGATINSGGPASLAYNWFSAITGM
jgi:hypothetical protein